MITTLPTPTCVLGDHTVDHTTMLTDVLKLHFGWNLARIKCLSCLIIALFGPDHIKVNTFGKPYLPTLHIAFQANKTRAEVPTSIKESCCGNMARRRV